MQRQEKPKYAGSRPHVLPQQILARGIMTAHGKNVVKQHDDIGIRRKSAGHNKSLLQKLGVSRATPVRGSHAVSNINYGSVANILEARRHVPANLIKPVIESR